MSDNTCQVPLTELLRSIPIDRRDSLEVGPHHWRNIPYGVHCHAAADRIDTLERELTEARRELEVLKADDGLNTRILKQHAEQIAELQHERSELEEQLTAHKEMLGMCREIIEGCINNQPASEGGGMYYERFDGDGNYSGAEHVDPAAIYQATLDELHKALTAIAKLKEGK